MTPRKTPRQSRGTASENARCEICHKSRGDLERVPGTNVYRCGLHRCAELIERSDEAQHA